MRLIALSAAALLLTQGAALAGRSFSLSYTQVPALPAPVGAREAAPSSAAPVSAPSTPPPVSGDTIAAAPPSGADWGYRGASGPAHWAGLQHRFAACGGRNQSPIDLRDFTESLLGPIAFHYRPAAAAWLNTGHGVQLGYRQPRHIVVDRQRFDLRQIHFRAPSEHLIEGERFALELQLIHRNDRGEIAVVALLFRQGAAHPALAQALSELPRQAGESVALDAPINPDRLLPADRDHYRYNGSLTTPPCTEGVRWLVLKSASEASAEQLTAIAQALGGANNRPVQARNARPVLK